MGQVCWFCWWVAPTASRKKAFCSPGKQFLFFLWGVGCWWVPEANGESLQAYLKTLLCTSKWICWTWTAVRFAYLQRWSPSFMTGLQYLLLTLPVLSSWGAKEAAVWQDSRLVVPGSCPLWDAFWTGKFGSDFILCSGELYFPNVWSEVSLMFLWHSVWTTEAVNWMPDSIMHLPFEQRFRLPLASPHGTYLGQWCVTPYYTLYLTGCFSSLSN